MEPTDVVAIRIEDPYECYAIYVLPQGVEEPEHIGYADEVDVGKGAFVRYRDAEGYIATPPGGIRLVGTGGDRACD